MEKNLKAVVEKVMSRIPQANREEIEKKLKILIYEFSVPENEAIRCVMNQTMKELGIEKISKNAKIGELKDGENVDVRFKVLRIRESLNEKVAAILVIGDESGITRAVVMKNATAIKFEKGKCYLVKNALSRNGLLITKSSAVFPLEESINVKPLEFVGSIVNVSKNSGFVARCSICNSRLLGTNCKTHGKVKPITTYEAKITVDNGEKALNVLVKEKDLEMLSRLSKEDANKIRLNYASNDPVYSDLVNRLIGRYVRVMIGEEIKVCLIGGEV